MVRSFTASRSAAGGPGAAALPAAIHLQSEATAIAYTRATTRANPFTPSCRYYEVAFDKIYAWLTFSRRLQLVPAASTRDVVRRGGLLTSEASTSARITRPWRTPPRRARCARGER